MGREKGRMTEYNNRELLEKTIANSLFDMQNTGREGNTEIQNTIAHSNNNNKTEK